MALERGRMNRFSLRHHQEKETKKKKELKLLRKKRKVHRQEEEMGEGGPQKARNRFSHEPKTRQSRRSKVGQNTRREGEKVEPKKEGNALHVLRQKNRWRNPIHKEAPSHPKSEISPQRKGESTDTNRPEERKKQYPAASSKRSKTIGKK